MMRKIISLALIVLLLSAGCKDKKNEKYTTADKTDSKENIASEEHPGKKMLETECNLCHSPIAPEDSRLAPPMIAIKKHYILDSTTKEQFQKDLIRWINNPTEEISKMPGALKKFGIMPLQPYPEEKIKLMAEYLYDFDIEEPEWFQDHYQKEHGKRMGKGKQKRKGLRRQNRKKDVIEVGLNYALSTKAQLGKNLKKVLNEEGPAGAVEFCNVEAMKLTDSISVMHNAIIKRVSDKPRNPKNIANVKEMGHISAFKTMVKSDAEIKPITQEINGEVNFYYPITTNTMCLKCHGKPNEEISSSTLSTLKELYPNDKAVGYDVGQVRGIWSISFAKNSID